MKITILTGLLAATVTLFPSIVKAEEPQLLCDQNSRGFLSNKISKKQKTANIKNSSGTAEISLAQHLSTIKAKMYGAFWCPYCQSQKEFFGKQAWQEITYIECDPKGENPRPDLCRKANIKGYPTWEIKGKFYPGRQSLETLAEISGYKGKRNFKN